MKYLYHHSTVWSNLIFARIDSTKKPQQQLANNLNPKSAFEKYNTLYSSDENDPVELNEYYNSYKNGDYAKVLSARDADYQLMSGDERNKLLQQYMQFYKGLSYLAENKAGEAIQKFETVLRSAPKKASPYYEAQWYTVLAFLKTNDISKTIFIAKDIAQSGSMYKEKATQLLRDLNNK